MAQDPDKQSLAEQEWTKAATPDGALIEVTIKQLQAVKFDPAKPWYDTIEFIMDGINLRGNDVNIVGLLTKVELIDCVSVLTIDDGTGVIVGKLWHVTNMGQVYDPPMLGHLMYVIMCICFIFVIDIYCCTILLLYLYSNRYISVDAAVKVFDGELELTVFGFQEITDFDQLTYHSLKVIKNHLQHVAKYKSPPATGDKTKSKTESKTE